MGDDPGQQPAETVGYIVTVQSQYLGRVEEVTGQLESAGMTVERVLGTLGQIIGRAEEAKRTTLAGVEGVQSVDPERRFRINPPDSDIQ
ncbi:hypothetical protein [Paeniglutamicibacter sulfureus]|uniref:Uncharacterized protein n=2 Tax=Paeniglutamicibacter TaxID=1742990 RepID=A0ABU2BDY8_9MICC|nr:hypothetical protein [Paeniglutamicibacter sulfureus]MDO2936505.1 hypothetical protein [Paeniglutamicibacter sulfureus]MDR7356847.1 hypothetical protein [Paeniglutamicibacter sulfureus]